MLQDLAEPTNEPRRPWKAIEKLFHRKNRLANIKDQ